MTERAKRKSGLFISGVSFVTTPIKNITVFKGVKYSYFSAKYRLHFKGKKTSFAEETSRKENKLKCTEK